MRHYNSHMSRVSSKTRFISKDPELDPKLVSTLLETERLNSETASFGVSVEPKKKINNFGCETTIMMGNAAWTWTCSMVMDMEHGHRQLVIQQGHGHLARRWTCSTVRTWPVRHAA